MPEEKQINEYKGYSLFNDVMDDELRGFNRGTVLANILESGQVNTKVRHDATADLLYYFSQVPKQERLCAITAMEDVLADRGIMITDVVKH